MHGDEHHGDPDGGHEEREAVEPVAQRPVAIVAHVAVDPAGGQGDVQVQSATSSALQVKPATAVSLVVDAAEGNAELQEIAKRLVVLAAPDPPRRAEPWSTAARPHRRQSTEVSLSVWPFFAHSPQEVRATSAGSKAMLTGSSGGSTTSSAARRPIW